MNCWSILLSHIIWILCIGFVRKWFIQHVEPSHGMNILQFISSLNLNFQWTVVNSCVWINLRLGSRVHIDDIQKFPIRIEADNISKSTNVLRHYGHFTVHLTTFTFERYDLHAIISEVWRPINGPNVSIKMNRIFPRRYIKMGYWKNF